MTLEEFHNSKLGDVIFEKETTDETMTNVFVIKKDYVGDKEMVFMAAIPTKQACLWKNAEKLLQLTKDMVNNYEKKYSYLFDDNIKRAKELIAKIEDESQRK